MKSIYDLILQRKVQGKKSLAVLIDPDKIEKLAELLAMAKLNPPHFFFIGGSLLAKDTIGNCIDLIRNATNVPIVIFPGNEMQVNSNADALLLLSVISGRNADLLIGKQVAAAGLVQASGLEIISTGYILIESGQATAVSYISNTQPIPRTNSMIAAMTALAGEQLGLKVIYLEAGSGAQLTVPIAVIEAVQNTITIPIFVGGGIKTTKEVVERCNAGADVIVVGNILEHHPNMLQEFSMTINAIN